MSVLLETTLGDLVVDLYTETRPRCAVNFLKLCKTKYYNYSSIFNVQRDFVVQCGDPEDVGNPKNGHSIFMKTHGEGARYFEAEKLPIIKHDRPGLLSMINNGSGKYGSQFLITCGISADTLDEGQIVFGEITEGIEETLSVINEAFCDRKGRPKVDIRITHTHILDDPFEDPEGLVVPSRSPSPDPERLFGSGTRVGADEILTDDEELNEDEQKERDEIRAAEHRANVLNIIGDLPSADVEPDKNVLFICKLNPVTTDEDLEIIFSRFGEIKCCEIIRDKRTDASLQYSFIEFATDEACERAFFKMDNVLIDDRRIHVDFSQSVAKKWRQWKTGGKHRTKAEINDSEEVPIKKEFSPKRSPSPKRRRRSPSSSPPRRRSRSPKKRSRSPKRELKRRSRSPKKEATAPKRRSRSPRKKSNSPKRKSRSPKKNRDSSPRRRKSKDESRRERRRSRSNDKKSDRKRRSRSRDRKRR